MRQLLLLNPESVSEEEVKTYSIREAVRGIVLDENSHVALLHVSKKGYYKLPGGGIEGAEDHILALQRECKEEIGCEIEFLGDVGSIVEYRKISALKQISYCYLAKLKGKKGEVHFTDEEKAGGFEQIWVTYENALQLMRECKTTEIESRDYIIPRDTTFLKYANH